MLLFKINNIKNLFVKGASLALIVMSVFIGYFWITDEYSKFEEQSENIGKVYLDAQKAFVRNEVQKIVDYLEYKKNLTEQILKNDIKERVESVHDIAMNIYLENTKTCSDDTIKKMIRDALRPIRFNNGRGYFFAVSMDGIEELYPTRPEFEGANVLELQDSKGNFVILDEIRIIKEHGQGYVRDYWPKPDEDPETAFPKISFVKYFPPLDWYFGTGEYLDDIEQDIRQEVLQYIKTLRYEQDGYIFINTLDRGSPLDYFDSSMPGENIFSLFSEEEMQKKLIAEMHDAYPEGTFISYDWIKPSTKKTAPKISYVRTIPDWGWVIGAGFYIDEINKTIRQDKHEIKKNVIKNLLGIVGIFLIGFALTLILAQNYSKQIDGELDAFTAFFLDAAQKNRKISKEKLSLVEFRTLADSVNIMVAEKEKVENELMENKRQLENLISGVDGYLWSADIDEERNIRYRIYTENIVKITGYEAEEFLDSSGELWNSIIHPDDIDTVNRGKRGVMNGKSGTWEYRITRKNGTIRWLYDSANPRFNEAGHIVGIFGVAVDITEKKQIEEDLLKMRKLESVGLLAGGIAHDFNNLLTAILGNISLAKMTSSPDEAGYKRLEEAENASMRAKDLTQQLLTFSKGGAPVKKLTDIGALIRDTATFVLRGSNVRLEFMIPDTLWTAEVDEGQLSQVINNLVINADQAMPNGGRITIKAENVVSGGCPVHCAEEQNRPCIKITVADEGIGIGKDHLGKIFDPYFTTKHQGSGLGLATTFAIIQKHQGVITVESTLEKGTTFHIYLPASNHKHRVEDQKVSSKPLWQGTGRILVMDDEEIVREVCGNMLMKLGYEVASAENGQEAIEKYIQAMRNETPFDLVIMDLTIPGGMGGKEAIIKLLEVDRNIRAVVSSGYSNDTIMANYREYGFRGIIAKPYNIKDLGNLVSAVMEEPDC